MYNVVGIWCHLAVTKNKALHCVRAQLNWAHEKSTQTSLTPLLLVGTQDWGRALHLTKTRQTGPSPVAAPYPGSSCSSARRMGGRWQGGGDRV